jgi:hypothetical protein
VKLKTVKLALACMAFALPVSAYAQSCPNLPVKDEIEAAIMETRGPFAPIPAKYQQIAEHGKTELTIRTLSGQILCFRTAGQNVVDSFYLSDDQRFFGFDYGVNEEFGYILVDRIGSGTLIDTGEKPIFSKDGKRIVSLQKSAIEGGGLEGLASWDITPQTIKPSFFTDLPEFTENPIFTKMDDSGCALIGNSDEQVFVKLDEKEQNSVMTLFFKNDIRLISGDHYQACIDGK